MPILFMLLYVKYSSSKYLINYIRLYKPPNTVFKHLCPNYLNGRHIKQTLLIVSKPENVYQY